MKTLVALLLLITTFAPAQTHKRDALSDAEADQLRELTDQPDKRIKLMVQFCRTRMLAIEQLKADPKLDSRGREMHDLIADFDQLVQELEDNLDMFTRQRGDLRKVMKEVVEAYSDWQVKLRALKETSTPAQLREYGFALDSAIDTINEGADFSREVTQKQAELKKDSKKKK